MRIGANINLPEDAARHACRVLRMREGEALCLFNGLGGECEASIVEAHKDRVQVKVLRVLDRECESPIQLTLVQSLQTGDKMDFTIQKAVELGVSRVVPVASQRSVLKLQGDRAEKRVAHWQGVVVSACEQCGRNRLPTVEAIRPLRDWLANQQGREQVLRLILLPEATISLHSLHKPAAGREVELLIGAEGGLSPEEVSAALAAGYIGVRLGPRVLRTETAGLAALASIQCLWGDFG